MYEVEDLKTIRRGAFCSSMTSWTCDSIHITVTTTNILAYAHTYTVWCVCVCVCVTSGSCGRLFRIVYKRKAFMCVLSPVILELVYVNVMLNSCRPFICRFWSSVNVRTFGISCAESYLAVTSAWNFTAKW